MTAPNVLLVVLDSVRARNTDLHGHVNDTTPFLSEFAAERATQYTQARAPAVWSLPSHASIFTGHHVVEHGLVERGRRLVSGATIWSDLREKGYETGLFTDNPYLVELPVGLDEGFDTVSGAQDLLFPEALNPRGFVHEHGRGQFRRYLRACLDNDRPAKSLLNGVAEKVEQDASWLYPGSLPTSADASVYADRFLEWQSGTDGPWAACLNLMDAHTPYTPGADHDHWGGEQPRALQAEMDNQIWEFYGGQRPWWQLQVLETLYDGAIHRIDAQIRRLVETLEERGALEDTLLVVTSDHGEGFGERSIVRPDFRLAGHQCRGIAEQLLHVPLLVQFPGQEEPLEVAEPATLTAFPSVVEQVLDGEWTGQEFVPDGPVLASCYGLDEQKATMANRYCSDVAQFTGEGHAVYSREDDQVRKSVVWDHRSATVRVVDSHVSFALDRSGADAVNTVLAETSDAGVTTTGDDESVSASTQQRLEDLGYV